MEDDACFAGYKVVVVGLGLMGGSLALGLKAHNQTILAVDPDPDTREYAFRNRIVDRVSADPGEIISEADVIILSAPVDAVLAFIPSLPGLHPGSPIILDLGSTKAQICQALTELPPRFEAVGGHPMCGKVEGGIMHADPAIFKGSAFAFTHLNRTRPHTQRFVEWLAEIIGAYPLWLDADTHDRWVAATSHVPYLLSSALALATPSEAFHLVGPGFLGLSRLAASPTSVMLPIIESNRENILESIAHFRQQLDEIEAILRREDYSEVGALLDRARRCRELLTGLHE